MRLRQAFPALACAMILAVSGVATADGLPDGEAVTTHCSVLDCLWEAEGFALAPYERYSFNGRCPDVAALAPPEIGIHRVSLTLRCVFFPALASSEVRWVVVSTPNHLFFDGFETPALRWSAVESPAS